MNTPRQPDRLQWIDAAKGIGIFLVVLGHAIRPGMIAIPWCDFLFRFIYAFHMPLFFVLSGYTFAISYARYLNAPVRFIRKRAQTLLVPLISYAAAIYLCFFIAYRIPPVGNLLSASSFAWVNPLRYLYLLFAWENPYAAHLWYIWVLFAISLLAFALAKLLGGNRWKLILTGLSVPCLIVAVLLPIPTAIRKMMAYLLFFAVGVLGEQYGSRLQELRRTTAALAGVGTTVILLLSALSTAGILPDYGWIGILKSFVIAVAVIPMIFGIIQLCRSLSGLRILTAAGRSSFAVYLLHQPFCCGFAGILLYDRMQLPAAVVLVLCTVLSFALPAAIVRVAHRVKWIGRIAKSLLNI